MRKTLLISLLIIIQTSFAQKKDYYGQLVNSETKKPVFGAAIELDGEIVSLSNEFGKFKFRANINRNKFYIKFKHISYLIDSIKIKELKRNHKIVLFESFNILDEVDIIAKKKLSKKEIIKKIIQQFENSKRKKPYWSQINYKQTISHKGIAKAYYEMDGNALMIAGNKYIFDDPFLIPKQIRRTTEPQIITDLWMGRNKKNLLKISHDVSRFSLFEYRCFEILHPISKYGNRFFKFKFEKSETINKKEFYVLHFKQVKNTN